MLLLIAEHLPTEETDKNLIEKRHLVSVIELVQKSLALSRVKIKNHFPLLF